MRPEDGFIITGGGFLVTGVGDVNYDSINDMMITAYYDWNGQSGSYLITSPKNMTYSPSIQPSSFPTPIITSLSPSVFANTMNSPISLSLGNVSVNSRTPTRRPSQMPRLEDSTFRPSRLILSLGTSRPSLGKPSFLPTLSPTTGYHNLRGFSPTLLPTRSPTINMTNDFIEIVCEAPGDYYAKNASNYKFIITASNGIVNIMGNEDGGAKNLYVLSCPSQFTNVIIKNFRLSTDIISVTHLISFSFHSLGDISHSSRGGPLTLLFCSRNRLQVVLASHTSFDLQESNFLFIGTNDTGKKSVNNSVLAQVQVGIVLGVFLIFFVILKMTKATEDQDQAPKKWTSRFDQFEDIEDFISSSSSSCDSIPRLNSVAHSSSHLPDPLENCSFASSSAFTALPNGGNVLSSSEDHKNETSGSCLHSSLYTVSSDSTKDDNNKYENQSSRSFTDLSSVSKSNSQQSVLATIVNNVSLPYVMDADPCLVSAETKRSVSLINTALNVPIPYSAQVDSQLLNIPNAPFKLSPVSGTQPVLPEVEELSLGALDDLFSASLSSASVGRLDKSRSSSLAEERGESSCSSLHSSLYALSSNETDVEGRDRLTSNSSGSRTLELLFTDYDDPVGT
jgi:hypothetical protein